MRIVSIFFWIIIGAILVYFFTANASQYVSLDLLYTTYSQVSLAIVIFMSIFIGVIMGTVLMMTQYFKAKGEVVGLRREIKSLQQKIDEMPVIKSKKETVKPEPVAGEEETNDPQSS